MVPRIVNISVTLSAQPNQVFFDVISALRSVLDVVQSSMARRTATLAVRYLFSHGFEQGPIPDPLLWFGHRLERQRLTLSTELAHLDLLR